MTGNLPQLRLGPLAVDFPVVLAAMAGYTDWPTRRIARNMGAGYTVSEALLDRFVVNVTKGKKARRFLRVTGEDHPVGAQLMGHAADELAAAAGKLVEAGFDAVDLNFGCPVRKVLSKCRGGHLLSDPERALKIVAGVRDALPPKVPVTVKMRRGTDESDRSREDFFTVFDGAFALGAAAVTVHGRTVRQRYEGPSSWAFLREVKEHAGDRTVLGSGDLFTAQDCLDMIAQTGVDGVTVARGAIGNPWIFREARALAAGRPLPPPPSLLEQREVIAEHYRLAEEIYGPARSLTVMRKLGIKYSRMHPQAQEVRDAFVAVRDPNQWQKVLDRWYSEDLPGRGPKAE
ncbi:MAG: tRNA-dihydrouridine synthase [Planctomycetes bacterium RBG_16_64_12]|nr:MAG: tRNA-dihydrouridine synthase [Planctomycetes bacterium RBG_16_64_12]